MPDEVINIDLNANDEKKSREERKANGRYAAVIIALIIILLAIYHAWIRKTAVLAGILVPALIMILYGGWVIFLTKRDKKRRLLMTRQMEENARLEIAQQIAAATTSHKITNEKCKNSPTKMMTTIIPSTELTHNKLFDQTIITPDGGGISSLDGNKYNKHFGNIEKHRKRKHKKRTRPNATSGGPSKRPSFRDRLTGKRKINNNKNNLQLPPYLCRTNSAP